MPKARQTCTECSMRRQKCDRQSPCSRCVKRGEGDKCTRTWPGQYDPKVHRIYPRTDTKSATDGDKPATEVENAATVLEYLSWGRTKLSDFDVKVPDLLREPHQSGKYNGAAVDWELENGFGGTGAAQMSFLQLLMPSRKQVYDMVDYHENSILWYHGAYHGPTFRKELGEVYQSPSGFQVRSCDLRWLALLFATMTASMTCASRPITESWGFLNNERAKLTTQWYKAAVTCLNLANYMLRHHIHSVEAIATLTLSAHILGFSNEQFLLLGSAVKIAQSLGLQRIGPDSDDVKYRPGCSNLVLSPAHRERLIKRETGRRLWAQLCLQDWFSIPYSEMYSINCLHYSTIKPINCDDDTMEPLPESVPTNASFLNFLFDLAYLMPPIHDAICGSSTLYTKYQYVLEYDAKLRSLATDALPTMFSMRESLDASWPPYIAWARRSISICVAHKVIMIHRSFLGRSFTNHAFAITRRSCITAAKTILKEAKQAYDEEGPQLWIDQAFMVAGAIVLVLDTFHRCEHEPEFGEHRGLVENTITMLGKFENSMIASRGIRLLSSLLNEHARLVAHETLAEHKKRVRDDQEGAAPKKPKFDVPRFVENFRGSESFTRSLGDPGKPIHEIDVPYQETGASKAGTPMEHTDLPDFSYETFAELFPPQTGISNAFLFEDLLNFDLV